MRHLFTLAGFIFIAIWLFSPSSDTDNRQISQPEPYRSLSQQLAIIASGWTDPEAQQRFEFIVPRFVRACSDTSTEQGVGDSLVKAHRLLQEATVADEEGGLLGVSNSLYSIVMRQGAGSPNSANCSDLFALYVTLRQMGMSAAEVYSAMLESGGSYR